MSNDMNEVLLVGTIFGDLRYSTTKTGGSCCQFSITVKRPEPSKSSDVINAVAWDDVAEKMVLEFGPNRRIRIRGRLVRSSYVSKDGSRKSFTKVDAVMVDHPDEDMNLQVQEEPVPDYGYAV